MTPSGDNALFIIRIEDDTPGGGPGGGSGGASGGTGGGDGQGGSGSTSTGGANQQFGRFTDTFWADKSLGLMTQTFRQANMPTMARLTHAARQLHLAAHQQQQLDAQRQAERVANVPYAEEITRIDRLRYGANLERMTKGAAYQVGPDGTPVVQPASQDDVFRHWAQHGDIPVGKKPTDGGFFGRIANLFGFGAAKTAAAAPAAASGAAATGALAAAASGAAATGALAAAGPIGLVVGAAIEVADAIKEKAGRVFDKTVGHATAVMASAAGGDNLQATLGVHKALVDLAGEIPVVGDAFKMVAGPAQKLAESFFTVTNAFLDRARELRIYNPQIANSLARADVSRVYQRAYEANALGPQLSKLVDAQSRAEVALNNIWMPIKQYLLENLTQILEGMAATLERIEGAGHVGVAGIKTFLNPAGELLKFLNDPSEWVRKATQGSKSEAEKAELAKKAGADFMRLLGRLDPANQNPLPQAPQQDGPRQMPPWGPWGPGANLHNRIMGLPIGGQP